ncbi:MAG: putative amidophosphoribosyltransferase [Rhodothermales bacterium]|jgi:predicted amidophosphoribosyltransferase
MTEMVECPSCKKEISKRAKMCPKCGRNTKEMLHHKPDSKKQKSSSQASGQSATLTKERSTASRRTG